MPINNIAEAQKAVSELGEFLEKFNRTLGALGSLTGNINGESDLPGLGRIKTGVFTVDKIVPKPAPQSMQERVLTILGDAAKPITPTEMVAHYQALGWPKPPSGNLYSSLLACAYYLFKKGKLARNNGKYSIPMESPVVAVKTT